MQQKILLASQSKYRCELLQRLNIDFATVSPDIDETPFPNEDPYQHVLRLAKAKALAKADKFPGHLIIGADIITLLGNEITSKPHDYAMAFKYLQQSSGQVITNLTGVCVLDASNKASNEKFLVECVETKLKFRALAADEIKRYIEKEQPYDNAGAFRFQGVGIALLESVETTDPTAIIGLPLIKLAAMLTKFGCRVI